MATGRKMDAAWKKAISLGKRAASVTGRAIKRSPKAALVGLAATSVAARVAGGIQFSKKRR